MSLSSIRTRSLRALLLPLALACASSTAFAQEVVRPKDAYFKIELMIPMRDGVELFTQIFEPANPSGAAPMMLLRTPYGIGHYGEGISRVALGPSALFNDSGYIFVYQDVRGKFRSEGEFEVMRPVYSILDGEDSVDESTDTYDTIEWLQQNLEGHNGRVGMWGISYPGFQVVMGMINAHPALVAASPQASPADMYMGDDFHHNGAFRLMYTFGWLSAYAASREGQSSDERGAEFDYGTKNGYEFFLDLGPVANADERYFHERVPTWNDYMDHGSYDEFFQRQGVLQHMHDIGPAVLNVAGWFDAEDFYGPMQIYYAIERNDPDNRSSLVVGPWQHGAWSVRPGNFLGSVPFDSNTGEYYREKIERPFFRAHLEEGGVSDMPEAIVFETGSNTWHEHESWPPPGVEERSLFLQEGGGLSFVAADEAPGDAYDEFVSDPANPVPFSANPGVNQGHVWMIEDQRFLAGRDDVLVYQTEPLTETLRIAGPIVASLRFETTGTDCDWIVKLIDVAPEGASSDPFELQRAPESQMLLAGEVFRAKFHKSFEHPEPLVPGEITELEFELGDKYHSFLPGHRIMVQIQSSWFPVIDRNPQTFVDIYHAKEADFQAATHRVHRGGSTGTHLRLMVLGE